VWLMVVGSVVDIAVRYPRGGGYDMNLGSPPLPPVLIFAEAKKCSAGFEKQTPWAYRSDKDSGAVSHVRHARLSVSQNGIFSEAYSAQSSNAPLVYCGPNSLMSFQANRLSCDVSRLSDWLSQSIASNQEARPCGPPLRRSAPIDRRNAARSVYAG
jgi:hypothetical protein